MPLSLSLNVGLSLSNTASGGGSAPVVPSLVELAPTGSEISGAANGTALRTISPWVGAVDGGTTANQDVIQVQSGAVRTGGTASDIYAVTYNPQSFSRRITGTFSALPASSTTLARVYVLRAPSFNTSLFINMIYTQDANAGVSTVNIVKRVLGTSTTLVSGDFSAAGSRLQLNDTFVIEATAEGITFKGFRSGSQRGPTVSYTFATAQGIVSTGNIGEPAYFRNMGFDNISSVWDVGALTVAPLNQLGVDYVQPVIQRTKGSPTTKVTFTGTMVPGTASLEARLVDSSGTVVSGYDWAALPAALGTRKWAAFYNVPTGGNYRLQVRATATPATVAQSNDFGIGAIILAYGQSNIGHWRTDTATGATDNAKAFVYHGVASGWHPIGRDPSGGTTGMGGALAASDYVTQTGLPAMIITQGISGATATALSKGNASGYYTNMMAEVQALGGKLEGIFYEQGHGEAPTLSQSTNKADYKTVVTQLIADIRADLAQSAADLPAMITLMPPNPELIPGGSATNSLGYQTMRQAQIELAASIPNARLSDHEMDAVFISETPTYNGHYAGTWLESGRRKARALAAANGYVTNDLRGALPLSAAVSGNQLTVTYDLNGGTGLSLPTPGSPVTDWQVAVNDAAFGSLNAITATSIGTPSGGQVVVTHTLTTALTSGQTAYVRNGYGYWFTRTNTLKTDYAAGASVATFPIVTALTAVA